MESIEKQVKLMIGEKEQKGLKFKNIKEIIEQ
jgi:hypothetical protein